MKFAELFKSAADVGLEAAEGVVDTADAAVAALPIPAVLKADARSALALARGTLVKIKTDVDTGTGDLIADAISGTTAAAIEVGQLAKDAEAEYQIYAAAAANLATMAAQALAKIKPLASGS